jgi:hypothetical protein
MRRFEDEMIVRNGGVACPTIDGFEVMLEVTVRCAMRAVQSFMTVYNKSETQTLRKTTF